MLKLLVLTLTLSASVLAAAAGENAPAAPMRNAKLRDLPDNTWMKLGPFKGREKGASEVNWCYDPDGRRLVRFGGCTSTYSNECWSFDLGTEAWTQNLRYARDAQDPKRCPSDRPGYGCNRGICYDRENQCFWVFGGASSDTSPGWTTGLWKGVGDLGVGKWTHLKSTPSGEAARVQYDETARKVVCIFKDMGSWGQTWIYDPKTDKAVQGDADPSGAKEGRAGGGGFPGFVYVPELKGCLYVAGMPAKFKKDGGLEMTTWLFDAATGKWKDLSPQGPVPSRRSGMGLAYDSKSRVVVLYGGGGGGATPPDDTWAYDPARNAWTELKPETSPGKFYKKNPNGVSEAQMMAYDQEHNVHVLVLQNWQVDNAVWVYRHRQ